MNEYSPKSKYQLASSLQRSFLDTGDLEFYLTMAQGFKNLNIGHIWDAAKQHTIDAHLSPDMHTCLKRARIAADLSREKASDMMFNLGFPRFRHVQHIERIESILKPIAEERDQLIALYGVSKTWIETSQCLVVNDVKALYIELPVEVREKALLAFSIGLDYPQL